MTEYCIYKKIIIKTVVFKIIILLFSLLIFSKFSFAESVKVFEFSKTELSQLKVRKVRGADNKTVYSIGSNENGNYLKAVAENAGSGLGKEIKIDLNKTPFINITWKIEQDLSGINEKLKKVTILLQEFLLLKKQEQHHCQTGP